MIQIIPNIHPVLVHFTVALFSAAVGFYGLAYLLSLAKEGQRVKHYSQEFETVSRWCLWVAALITLATVGAGLSASMTVRHDEPSHLAMLSHRSWALLTVATMIVLACWSIWRYYRLRTLSFLFLIALLVGEGLLLSTAWHGAELVFRYGLGVMSLPKLDTHPHTAAMAASHHDSQSMTALEVQGSEISMLPTAADTNHHHE